mgnify:CR=1 FL=1
MEWIEHIIKTEKIRISVAIMVLIEDIEWKIALLINKNRAENGESVLTPIWWAIECTEEWKQELISLLGITEDAFEKGNDLRLSIPLDKIDAFRDWLSTRSNREISPKRELHEELIDEEVLLCEQDLENTQFEQIWYYQEVAKTNRKWNEWAKTLRIAEVFRVKLNKVALEKLSNVTQIKFVTKEEVLAWKAWDWTQIWTISNCLVNFTNSI